MIFKKNSRTQVSQEAIFTVILQDLAMKKGSFAPNLKLSLPPPDEVALSKFLYLLYPSLLCHIYAKFICTLCQLTWTVGSTSCISYFCVSLAMVMYFDEMFLVFCCIGLNQEHLRMEIFWWIEMEFELFRRVKLQLYTFSFELLMLYLIKGNVGLICLNCFYSSVVLLGLGSRMILCLVYMGLRVDYSLICLWKFEVWIGMFSWPEIGGYGCCGLG